MSFTTLTGPGRVVQFMWGARNQNALTFAYPASVDVARFWREPRTGSEQAFVNNTADSWLVARDYMADMTLRWMQLSFWASSGGVQGFLDWSTGGGTFAIVPDAVNAPLFALTGCLLVGPFDQTVPNMEADGSQSYEIVVRSPTYDLGLAWR